MSFRILNLGGTCGFRPTVVVFSSFLVWGEGSFGEFDGMEGVGDESDISSEAKLGV